MKLSIKAEVIHPPLEGMKPLTRVLLTTLILPGIALAGVHYYESVVKPDKTSVLHLSSVSSNLKISYTLPYTSSIKIALYSSGVYFLRLETQKEARTSKLIVIR